MRRLTEIEGSALAALKKHGSYCPGSVDAQTDGGAALLKRTMDSLVKKKRVTFEMTDDGPRYHAL